MHNRQVKAFSLMLATALLSPIACGRPHGRTVYVELPAGGVREGAPVLFHGFEIGIVQRVTPRRSGLIATVLIQRPDAPVQSNDHVSVHISSIFGDQAIDISPSPSDGPPLRDGDTLHAAPPDTLAAAREALTRAIVHEFTERMLRSDSARRGNRDPRSPRP